MRAAGLLFVEAAQEVDRFFDVVVAAVGTSRLNIEVIGSVGRFGRSDAAVPTAGRIAPFVDFAPPAVENQCAEAHNAFVALLGFEHVVDPVAVGGEGIGKFEFTFGDGYAESIVLRVGHRVAVFDKRDQQPDGERAALGEFVTGVDVVAHEEGCGTPLAVKLPFVEGCARTVVGGTGLKTDPQRRAPVISRFFGFFAVGSDDHHRRLGRRHCRVGHLPNGRTRPSCIFRHQNFHFARFHRIRNPIPGTERECTEQGTQQNRPPSAAVVTGRGKAMCCKMRGKDKVHIFKAFDLQKYQFGTTEQKKCALFFGDQKLTSVYILVHYFIRAPKIS